TASSFIGSMVDTLIFFSLAFAGTGLPWASWAAGDFCAKLIMIALLLYPFRLVVRLYPTALRV
ncbi:MAG: VUT family protein, partial [Arenicellales bacterium]